MAPMPDNVLRDPLLLTPAERIRDLVSAVERDDLLAVVFVLQNAPAAEVLAQPTNGGGHALDVAVRAPIKNAKARKFITECILFSTLPDFDVERYFASLPAVAQSSVAGMILREWNKGARDEDEEHRFYPSIIQASSAGDAYSLCEDFTMGQVEDWIATHLKGQSTNEPGHTEPGEVMEPVQAIEEKEASNAKEDSAGSPTLSASDMIKREASLSASPSVSKAPALPPPTAEEESKPVLTSAGARPAGTPSSTASVAVESTAQGRLVIRNLPTTVTVLQLKDLVGAAMLGYTLAVSIPQDQATATVEVTTTEAAYEVATRLQGHAIAEGGTQCILHTEVVLPTPSPSPSASKDVAPPVPPASLTSSPPEPRFRETSTSHVKPSVSTSRGGDDKSRRDSLPKRPRFRSPSSTREWIPSHYEGALSPRRYESRSPSRRSPSPRRSRPPVPELFWYTASHLPATISERRLTDDLLDVHVHVYDIVVEEDRSRNNRTPSRIARIAFESKADAKTADYYFTCHPYEGRTLTMKAMQRAEPRRDVRVRYVDHRYNITHPPVFPYTRVVIRGMNPSYSTERDLYDLLRIELFKYTIDRLYIEPNPGPYSSVAHLTFGHREDAVKAIERFDGFVADKHALSVNWDDPDWHRPVSPPPRWRQYGQ